MPLIDPEQIGKLPKHRRDWLHIFGNQWGACRFIEDDTRMTPEEKDALKRALNPFEPSQAK